MDLMGWFGFGILLSVIGLSGLYVCLSRELRDLQRWRDDVSALCRQHLEEKDG